jgi:hypothetical protein
MLVVMNGMAGRDGGVARTHSHLAAGGVPEHVAAAVKATTKFYAPDPT